MIKRGTTRIVVLTKRYAIKLPNILDGWRLFLNGLLANMQEVEFSATGWPELCPVLFSLPGGFLVVMPRAEELTPFEFANFDFRSFCFKEYIVPAEFKISSFGMLNGKIVTVDYG